MKSGVILLSRVLFDLDLSMNFLTQKIHFPVLLLGLVLLSGCSAFPEYNVSSERTAGGEYSAEENVDALSPEEQHKLARAAVDPVHVNKPNAYVKNVKDINKVAKSQTKPSVKPAKKPETLLAKMEKSVDVVKKEFKGLKDSVSRSDVSSAPQKVASQKAAPQKTTSQKLASLNTAAGAHVSVKNVRAAVHPGKTRLVFDLNGSSDFEYEIDNVKGLLLIRLAADGWDADVERVFRQSKILKAYASKPAKNGGTVVALKLHGPAKILTSQKLGKNAAGFYRIYFDVAPL